MASSYAWWDIFKVYSFAFEPDPLSRKNDRNNIFGAAVTNPTAVGMLDIRGDQGGSGSNNLVRIGTSGNEMVDLTSIEDRIARYKEYERLRNIAEVENCMTVFADEACVSGHTKVATPFGFPTMRWLAENKTSDRFLVYCWDFEKEDYTLGWAFNPRKTGTKKTVRLVLDDGTTVICTPDHRILKADQEWIAAGDLDYGDELMPFYKVAPHPRLSKLKTGQFPRIFTFSDGWTHERLFVDKWRTGKDAPWQELAQQAVRLLSGGLSTRQVVETMGRDWKSIESWLHKHGFSTKEIQWLGKKPLYRRVIGIFSHDETDVYDLSVEQHKCFATDSIIMHNCQKDDDGHVCTVEVEDEKVKEEAEYFLYKLVDVDNNTWNWFKNDIIAGDGFYELIMDPEDPKQGIQRVERLPQETMFRIETVKGRIVEFQQAKDGPDLEALKIDLEQCTDQDLMQSKATRFSPDQIVHVRHGEDRKEFRPYGVSLIEPARGPAHQLRMMEDAMLVYRLTRAPERRVFYIDVGTIAGARAETFIDRMKDQFKKRKTTGRGHGMGANSVEERWHAPSQDEDYWIPVRQNSNTRVETLPGACLSLDTKIAFLDGKERTLKEAIDAFNRGETLWTYSCCPITGKTAPGLVTWAGVTRKNTDVVKVTFDNGESVTCTPDHKFPVQGKGKVEAKDLMSGDSMFPFKRKMSPLSDTWTTLYENVYDTSTRSWEVTHRMVMDRIKGTEFEQIMNHSEEFSDEPKTVVHHKDINKFNNSPCNLARMGFRDHKRLHRDHQEITNANISKALKRYHEGLSEEDAAARDAILKERSAKGTAAVQDLLKTDAVWRDDFRKKQSEGWTKSLVENATVHKARGKKIAKRNLEFWSNPENKEKAFAKQTVVYPKPLFDKFVELTKSGLLLPETLELLNQNQELLDAFAEANAHMKRASFDPKKGLSDDHAKKMVKAYGYTGVKHLRRECENYNHKVVSVEFLPNKEDTGTLTIDGTELVHDYHTFALSACGVYTCNSNLGEIDDALYFRNKLYIALNFPKNYFNQDDVNQTRITLSAQDVRFARGVERLQSPLERGYKEMVRRHLYLRGYPEESYDDLTVHMTPPSDWRELSRAEVKANRMNEATTMKTSNIYPDMYIYTDVLKMPEDKAKEIEAMMKVQKLEDMKLQIIANNPQYLGVGLPGDGNSELGTEAGGPAPDLMPPDGGGAPPPPGGAPAPPPGGGMPPMGGMMSKYMDADPEGGQGQDPNGQSSSPPPLPDASEEDIKKYNMGIEDYASEQDAEDIDYSEL